MESKTLISHDDLFKAAGSNITPKTFDVGGQRFNIPQQYAHDPVTGAQALLDEVIATMDVTEVIEEFPGFTRDELAVALDVVLNSLSAGTTQAISLDPTETPSTRMVPVGYNHATGEMRHRVVPGGAMSLPGFHDVKPRKLKAWARIRMASGVPVVQAQVIRGDQDALNGLFTKVREQAATYSIYLGQVIDVNFDFIDISSFKPQNVALTDKLKMAINFYVRQQFVNRQRLAELGQSPKSGIMLEGPPGGGKSMTVNLCEYTCVSNGGVAIHVDPSLGVDGLRRAHQMANRLLDAGHVVMIVFEDMEKLAKDDRAFVLEMLDGGPQKGKRQITIGTTNFVDEIDPAMLRPGRFDAVVHCGLPDLSAFTQLVNILVPEESRGNVDYEQAFPYFEGYSYATITQAVSIVIRSAVSRGEDPLTVETEDLINAAELVRDHHELINRTPEKEIPALEQAFKAALADQFENVENVVINETMDYTDYGQVYSEARDAASAAIEARLDGAYIEDGDGNTSSIITN